MLNALRRLIASASRPAGVAKSRLSMQVGEVDLEPESNACPLCGSQAGRKPEVRVQDDPAVWFLRCLHCGGSSASRLPPADFLAAYYRGYFDGDVKVSFRGYERFWRHLRALGVAGASAGTYRILDFGGGDGRMALHAAGRMVEEGGASSVAVTLLDYHEPAAPPRLEVSIARARGWEDIAESSQDMALASGVLEHVPRPGLALKELARRLKPGAALYARMPYAVPMKRLFRDYDLQFPMHLHDMGPECWPVVCRDVAPDLSLERSQPSIVKYGPREKFVYWLASAALKCPAHVQSRLPVLRNRPLLWPWVGGWEVVLRKR